MNVRSMKQCLFALLLFISTTYIYADTNKGTVTPTLFKQTDQRKMNQWVDSVLNTMSLDQKVGQVIMVMAAGDNTESNRKKLTDLVNNQYVGSIVFSKGNPVDQADLTNLCQQNAKIPLMIAQDGEWGLSMRLENTTRFPKNMMVGAIQDDSLIYYYGVEVARQCRLMGIHVNFAPDMDVNSNPDNPVIGIRSFGEDPDWVSKLGILYARGLESRGVMSVAKHFPGHGDTSTDSHKVLPLVKHDKERLNDVELLPFKDFINAGLSGMMTAHLNIPAFDKSQLPSSLSKPITTDLLQKQLGFSGLIFTDGLAMKGVSTQPDMSIKALMAGNHILLGPISPEKEFNAIKAAVENGTIEEEFLNEKCRKILAYKYILGVHETREIDTKNVLSYLNTTYAEWIARRMNQKAITLLKNDHDIVPIKQLDKRKIAVVSIGESSNNLFQQTIKRYAQATCFSVDSDRTFVQLKAELANFNTVIVAIHANKTYNADLIQELVDDKNCILVFFTTPYRMSSYGSVIKKSDAVVMAYENTDFSQEYAAQAIFGGNAIEGKLPVSVDRLFKEGKGIETVKIRLSYNVPEDVGIPSSKLDEIDKIALEGMSQQAYPGCQILIAKDGVIIYNRSFGWFEYNGNKRLTNDNIFDIASMTKAVATLPAIMKLYDEKEISLQTPLSKYVSALRGTNKMNITVKEALLHESGLVSFIPYYMPAIDKNSFFGQLFSGKQSDLYPALVDNNMWGRIDYKFKPELISDTRKPGFDLQIADNLYANNTYKDTIIQMIGDSKLRPNKSYLYSCLNFILLKEVIENITDRDLNTFLQENFYRKLGAATTTFNPLSKFSKDDIVPTEKDDFLRKQLLQGYVHDEGAAFMGGIGGNAGLFSNANDLAKLCQMWLNKGVYGDERFLSKETTKLFTTTKSATSRRGLGFDKPDVRNNKLSPCSPKTPVATFGHTGFTGTSFWVDPDNNLIYIFLSNRIYDTRTNKKLMNLNIRSRIQEEIYNALGN